MLFDVLQDWLSQVTGAFLNPQKRVFVGYLGAALVIAVLAALLAGKGWRRGARRFLDPAIWLARSARTDYLIVFLNRAVMMVLVPRLLTHGALATALFLALHELFGGRPLVAVGEHAWAVIAGFTLFQFMIDDFSRYIVHRLLHRVSWLWPFHKVHHSAEVLTPLTVYRTHPVEGVLFTLRSAVSQGVGIGVFVFFFGSAVDLFTVLGASIFTFLFNALGSNLRHSHVPVRYGRRLERFLISPAQHQIHHSLDPRHHDRNFGAILAIWDRMAGSLIISDRHDELTFGVADAKGDAAHGLRAVYIQPFVESLHELRRLVRRAIKGSIDMMRHLPFQDRTRRAGRWIGLFGLVLMLGTGWAAEVRAERELDIYSHRQPFLIQPFIDAFSAETGVKVNVVFASKGLAQRLLIEGKRSPADLVLTVDIGRLSIYADKGLLKPVMSETLTGRIPANLRDPENRWFGLSLRARLVAVSRDRVPEGALSRIEDLANPEWQGRICSRPGSHVYNRALLSSVMAANGAEAAEAWAAGLVVNLARRPQGNDRAQVKAIYEGECDLAIINHYYFGKLKASEAPEQRDWASSVRLVFTNQADRGNHINISGGGVAKHADNAEDAVRFLEFLTGETAQRLYGEINTEYPVNPSVPLTDDLAEWGRFKADNLPISRIAELAPAAQRIIDRVGW